MVPVTGSPTVREEGIYRVSRCGHEPGWHVTDMPLTYFVIGVNPVHLLCLAALLKRYTAISTSLVVLPLPLRILDGAHYSTVSSFGLLWWYNDVWVPLIVRCIRVRATAAQWWSGSSFNRRICSSPAPLIHVDVFSGKTLYLKLLPCVWMIR